MGMFSDADFVSSEIHERQVVLGDGLPHVVHFRELPHSDYKRFIMHCTSSDEDVRAAAEARLVAAGVCEPDGSPALTLEQAVRLRALVLQRLARYVVEVNGWQVTAEGEEPGKP